MSFPRQFSRAGRVQVLFAVVCGLAFPPSAAPQQATSLGPEDAARHAQRMAQGIELFKQEVRPLLVASCLPCHGGGAQTMGSFDLSSRQRLADSGKLGDSAATSRFMKLLRHEQKPHMPFQQAKLADDAIGNIARWIDLGAPYDKPLVDKPAAGGGPLEITGEHREFWSFRPLARNTPPDSGDQDWPRTQIDRFILEKITSNGLTPNPAAGRRILIRRAYLDLLGLPPSPDEVDAFVNDPSPRAYENLIDRLLASQHYGERWARHWIDIARFAESHGFEADHDRPYAYHYRDFLIKSLNQDMPYDQFIRWQLAGDELAPGNPLALMATGFLGGGAFPDQITEHEFETVRYDELDDMIGTMGTTMLGLTVGCARCHEHKYDPIPTRDYYRLASTFGRTVRTEIAYDPDPEGHRVAKAKWEKDHQTLIAARGNYEREHLAEPFREWLQGTEQQGPGQKGPRQQDTPQHAADRDAALGENPWQVLDLTSFESKEGATFEKLADGSILVGGPNPKFDDHTFTADIQTQGINSLRVEALTHPSLPSNGPGRSHSGQFRLGIIGVTVQPLADLGSEPVDGVLASAKATSEFDPGRSAQALLDLKSLQSGWSPSARTAAKDDAVAVEFTEPIGFQGGTRFSITLRYGYNSQYALGRPRLSISTAKQAPVEVGSGVPQAVVEGVARLKGAGTDALSERHRAALLRWFARSDKRWRHLDETVQAHAATEPLSLETKMQVAVEGFATPRHGANEKGYKHFYEQTYLLNRGDLSQKREPVKSGFLRVLMRGGNDETHWRASPAEAAGQGRHTIESPEQGWGKSTLTRASLANWMTDSEQGGGALLARVIVNRLWHHHFGRGIVATPSDFGVQGDRPTHPELLDWMARDLIAHGWRLKRLHKLIMMSAVYTQSATTDVGKAETDVNNLYRWRWSPRRMEGEAVRDSLLEVGGMLDKRMYGPGSIRQDMRRRSIYFFIKRTELIPMMMLFDWPEHLVGIGRRPSTTIAPQALMFLNSPQARGYAEGFAGRLDGLEGPRAIRQAYRIAYGRPPNAGELADGEKFLGQQRQSYTTEGKTNADALALTDYCQTLLSLNEFLYIR